MRWLLIAVAVVVTVAAVVVLGGLLLPKDHIATRAARYPAPAESIWSAITDVAAYPSWRPGVDRVELLPSRNGHTTWREHGKQGTITLETVESAPPRRLVGRIADPNLPFGGTWTYEIEPAPNGSRLRITEHGEVYNPIYRFFARFVFGYTATMDDHLRALGKKYGAEVTPEAA